METGLSELHLAFLSVARASVGGEVRVVRIAEANATSSDDAFDVRLDSPTTQSPVATEATIQIVFAATQR